jgi:glycosyltransferase involved in cell wall biosynthesis
MIDLDIVLPCYQPPLHWHKGLIKTYEALTKQYKLQFILVLDGCPRSRIQFELKEILQQNVPLRLIELNQNYGKGYAIRKGVEVSTAAYVVYTDIDFPFTLKSLQSLLDTLTQSHCDVVAGIRDVNYYQHRMTFFRSRLSKAFRFFIKVFLKMPITDTQCGLKGFKSTAKPLFLSTRINRYLFDFEWIYRVSKNQQLLLKTVTVELNEGVVFRRMPLGVLGAELVNLLKILCKPL